jgi:hypothetical protein
MGLGRGCVLMQNGTRRDRKLTMDALPFPPGRPSDRPGPLARFLPPLETGTARRALGLCESPGTWVLDPFGASPRLAVELACSGVGLLTACNNPVTRFVLEGAAHPIPVGDLHTALAHLATAAKDNRRLEQFLLDLYLTACSRCRTPVSADRFVWDRETETPVVRTYTCPQCGRSGDDSTAPADREKAAGFARHGLQYALAVEQLATAGDPDREHAEAALAVYPGRAVFALITLLSKLGSLGLDPPIRRAAEALLLSTFDATNALWGFPEGRVRPRQLVASPHFIEANVWRALEAAVDEWDFESRELEVVAWPHEGEPRAGRISLFAGPSRELAATLGRGQVRDVLTVLPRPNQAYWTLSALWAAWLWGREAAQPIRVVLHRRRYDWAWHASALRAALVSLGPALSDDAQIVGLLPESEPGFIAAAALGFDAAGFEMTGQAMRAEEGQAVLRWVRRAPPAAPVAAAELTPAMTSAARQVVQARGEPTPFPSLHAAAWGVLAQERKLGPLLQAEEAHALTLLNDRFEKSLADKRTFVHFGAGAEAEVGQYWLADPATASDPLADRVEMAVVERLRSGVPVVEEELEADVCRVLPGLLTPDRRLFLACLKSYALPEDPAGTWRLRPEDHPEARARDHDETAHLLLEIGSRLGYTAVQEQDILWRDAFGSDRYVFRVRTHAAFGQALRDAGEVIHVLPGGRGSLVAEKVRRDPRLRAWLQAGLRLVKFRHVRRLAAETTLTPDNLEERLALDPIDESDPQLPLL